MQQSYLTLGPSVAMSKEEVDSFLEQKLVARFTSIRPDGYPHTTPLWYVWDGQMLWFLLGAGTYPRQHIRNLRRNPKRCVVIDRDVRPEQGGLFDAQGVVIRGTVELSTDEKLQEEITQKAMRKYLGHEGEQYVDAVLQDGKPGKNRVIAKVKPEHIVAGDFRKGQKAGSGSTA
jgi:nitroimidazol reductase NimA-like FMN-containing flavoprotein (pyridoxamine 5'-phosphate oxidase superfamily)